MTYRIDRRIVNASVEYKTQELNESAFKAIAECLEMIAEQYPANLAESSSLMKEKGTQSDGNNRKNKK